jgi:hypothetical protein
VGWRAAGEPGAQGRETSMTTIQMIGALMVALTVAPLLGGQIRRH